jgi:hypothetical protein
MKSRRAEGINRDQKMSRASGDHGWSRLDQTRSSGDDHERSSRDQRPNSKKNIVFGTL